MTDDIESLRASLAQVTAERDAANKTAARWRDGLAAMQVQRDNYKTLAGIGVWHADCRPNRHQAAETIQKQQAENDKLADEISRLRDRIALLENR